MENIKKFSPGVFGLALLCFFLPFVSVSCQGQKVATFTGVQLITGTTMEQPSGFGSQGKAKKIDGEPMAVVALASGVLGLGFSFLRRKKSAIIPAVLGGIGLVTLLVLQSKLRHEAMREGGILQLSFEIGYWLTALLYVSALGLNGFIFLKSKEGKIETEGIS